MSPPYVLSQELNEKLQCNELLNEPKVTYAGLPTGEVKGKKGRYSEG